MIDAPNPIIPKQWRWTPQADITALELALCIPVFSMGTIEAELYVKALPPEVRRHFTEAK